MRTANYYLVTNLRNVKNKRAKSEVDSRGMMKKLRYDEILQKDCIFYMPPIKFEDWNEQSESTIHIQDSIDLKTNNNNRTRLKKIREDENQSNVYKGWKPLSGIILSKNTLKVNFLKNWRKIYDHTHWRGNIKLWEGLDNYPLMFIKKHKLTLKEQARVYFNQRIGATFSKIIKEFRKVKAIEGNLLI